MSRFCSVVLALSMAAPLCAAPTSTFVTVQPERLDFGRVRQGVAWELTARVTLRGSDKFTLTTVATESNYVVPSVREVGRDATGVEYELRVTLRKDLPAGRWFSDVWLTTNWDGAGHARLPVAVETEPPLAVWPGQVRFGTETAERRVVVRAAEPFKVRSIGGTGDGLSASVDSLDARLAHVITLNYRAETPWAVGWRLFVETDQGEGRVIEVPVTAAAR